MSDKLTDDEKAYFESGGEADLPVKEGSAEPQEGTQPQAQASAEDPTEPQTAGEVEGEQSVAPEQITDERGHKVPLAKFMEEKRSRQERERALAEMQANYARLEERTNMLLQMQMAGKQPHGQEQRPQQPQVPDPEQDPIAALKWMQEREFERQNMTVQQRRAYEQQEQQRQVVQAYRQAAADFQEVEPGFQQAHGFLLQQRYQELMADGFDDAQARSQLQQEELTLAHDSLVKRRNPAERIMALAKARGWAPSQAAPAQQQDDRLKTVARGQEANQSLSAAGTSGNARGKVDAKAVADMSEKEFEAWFAKAGDDGFRAVMGG